MYLYIYIYTLYLGWVGCGDDAGLPPGHPHPDPQRYPDKDCGSCSTAARGAPVCGILFRIKRLRSKLKFKLPRDTLRGFYMLYVGVVNVCFVAILPFLIALNCCKSSEGLIFKILQLVWQILKTKNVINLCENLAAAMKLPD